MCAQEHEDEYMERTEGQKSRSEMVQEISVGKKQPSINQEHTQAEYSPLREVACKVCKPNQ